MKWNANNIIKFLEIYERYPVLWNVRLKEYLGVDAKLKMDMFKELMDVLNAEGILGDMTDKELRAKIKSVKDVYRQEMVKIEKSKKTATCPKDIYKPKLAWFEKAEFLREVISTRESKLNTSVIIPEVCLAPEESASNEEVKKEADPPAEIPEFQPVPSCSHQKRQSPPLLPEEVPPNKFNKRPMTSAVDVAIQKLSEISDKLKDEDAYDQFGKYISAELRQLPTREGIMLQQQLQNTIAQFKLGLC